MILLVFLWGYLGYREKGRRRWVLGNAVVFLGITTVIFYMTVYARGEGASEAVLVPFQSFREAKIQPELYRTMLMNVFLFLPVGLSLPFVLGKWKFPVFTTVVAACLFSAGIEYLQYRCCLGRCEVDDVIMNTLGAGIGCLAWYLSRFWEPCLLPISRSLADKIRRAVTKLHTR